MICLKKIEELRKEIDKVDNDIILLIKKRLDLVPDIREYKRIANLPIRQNKREMELIEKNKKHATSLGLNEVAIEKIFRILIDESIKKQEGND